MAPFELAIESVRAEIAVANNTHRTVTTAAQDRSPKRVSKPWTVRHHPCPQRCWKVNRKRPGDRAARA